MSDEPTIEVEANDNDYHLQMGSMFVLEGHDALCERLGLVCIYMTDDGPCAIDHDGGEYRLATLIKDAGKVVPLKAAK